MRNDDEATEPVDALSLRLAETADAYRKARQMSLQDVADASAGRLSKSRVAALLSGRQTWSARHMMVISDVLGVPVDLLVKDPAAGPVRLGVSLGPEMRKLNDAVETGDAVAALAALAQALKAKHRQ